MTLFHAYLLLLAAAVVLSFYNLKKGDHRLTVMASVYAFIIVAFHDLYFDKFYELGLGWYVRVAAAQWLVAWVAADIGCRAAKIIKPLAIGAVVINLGTAAISARYPHIWYWYASNLIQGAQVASLVFASWAWLRAAGWIHQSVQKLFDKHGMMKRATHGPPG